MLEYLTSGHRSVFNENMSNTLNTDQARLFGLLAPVTDVLDFGLDELVATLDALPSYAEFTIELVGTDSRKFRLMARDIPRPGRRYTNLDTGTEWMDLESIIRNQPDLYGVSVWQGGRHLAMAGVER